MKQTNNTNQETGNLLNEVQMAHNNNFQLLCCSTTSTANARAKDWLPAAELAYKLTKDPGVVVDDKISFNLADGNSLDISLLGGHYSIVEQQSGDVVHSGRKAVQLLMTLQKLSYEDAIEWLRQEYNDSLAENMKTDYDKMALEENASL